MSEWMNERERTKVWKNEQTNERTNRTNERMNERKNEKKRKEKKGKRHRNIYNWTRNGKFHLARHVTRILARPARRDQSKAADGWDTHQCTCHGIHCMWTAGRPQTPYDLYVPKQVTCCANVQQMAWLALISASHVPIPEVYKPTPNLQRYFSI